MKSFLIFFAAFAGVASAQQVLPCPGAVFPLMLSQPTVPLSAPITTSPLTKTTLVLVPATASATVVGSIVSQAATQVVSQTATQPLSGLLSSSTPVTGPRITSVTAAGVNSCIPQASSAPGASATGQTFAIMGSDFGSVAPPTVVVGSFESACICGSPGNITAFYLNYLCGSVPNVNTAGTSSTVAETMVSSMITWSPGLIIVKTTVPVSTPDAVSFTVTNNDTGQTAAYCLANNSATGCATSLYFN